MRIRLARKEDINDILLIINIGRNRMRKNGNLIQWTDGYPDYSDIMFDIENNCSYVIEQSSNNHNEIIGTFCLQSEPEPTYSLIYKGNWLSDEPYVTIHRISSSGKVKGVTSYILAWVIHRYKNIRIDTHESNSIMKHILVSNGFQYCGEIYVNDGTARKAYQYVHKEDL